MTYVPVTQSHTDTPHTHTHTHTHTHMYQLCDGGDGNDVEAIEYYDDASALNDKSVFAHVIGHVIDGSKDVCVKVRTCL